MTKIYIVIAGEKHEGGSIRDVRLNHFDAEIAARLLMKDGDTWKPETVPYDPDSNSPQLTNRWECSCDFIQIEEWPLR
jgi:hypothetical protein